MCKIVGLTGGIGCGKTTVLREFEKLGVPFFVMDDEAKKLYDDPAIAYKVKSIFPNPEDITDENGGIDRKKLGEIVFRDNYALKELNSLIHPMVRENFWKWCESHPDVDCVLVESVILHEPGFDKFCDEIIVVYLEENERIKRLIERDHTDIHHIRQRMVRQMPAEQKMLMADYLVLNYEGNPREKQVQIIDRNIRKTIQ